MDNINNTSAGEIGPQSQERIYWHEAFFSAIQMEFYDYQDVLTFESEHQLSKEALKVDVLIIKKKPEAKIEKSIGRIFRTHNIFEYKSEKDNLSKQNYIKTLGYAMIYSSFQNVDIEDITVSFVVTPKPVKLLNYLQNERNLEANEQSSGIYYIKGEMFPIQIIVSKELSRKESEVLQYLRSNLGREDLQLVLTACEERGTSNRKDAFLSRIFEANKMVSKEVIAMMSTQTQQEYIDFFEELGLLRHRDKRAEERARRDTALKMLRKGYPHDEIADNIEMPIEWVQSLTN